jgi:short-subunit dehydrogenase
MNKKLMTGVGIAGGAAASAYICSRVRKSKAENTDGTGRTVLITGASGGIGREMAFVFAKHHFDLVLVARNLQKLEELKKELEESCGVRVYLLSKDLSDENAAQEIYDEVGKEGITVDQLVNNAGAGKQDRVVDADPEAMRNLIHLNVTNLTGPVPLVRKGYGRKTPGQDPECILHGSFYPGSVF